MQIIPAKSLIKKNQTKFTHYFSIHIIHNVNTYLRKNLTKVHNFFPNAHKILNLEENSTAMHHGIVAIPPLSFTKEKQRDYLAR